MMKFNIIGEGQSFHVVLTISLIFAKEVPGMRQEGAVVKLGLHVRLSMVCRSRDMPRAVLRTD